MENKTARSRAVKKSLNAIAQDVLDILEADDGKSFEEKKSSILAMSNKVPR